MSGFTNGNISLDEERNIYYAGQVLAGKIEFGVNQPLQFKAINLIFHGEANVCWEEKEIEEYDGVRSYNTVQYGGEEVIFHVEQCVCGGVGVSQLQAGSHVIPFRFQIPPTVPSSFGTGDDDEERTIYYYVKAVLEYHDGREGEELEEDFDVVVPLDLNVNPEMKVQNEVVFEEAMSSCLCGSGLLNVMVTLPATGFVPGMTIPVAVEADNQSSVELTKIIFELVQRVKYFSTDPPSKKEEPETRLQYSKTGAVPAKTRRNFEHNFGIPDLIAVVTQNCNTIKVGYFFKMKLVLSGCNDDLEDEMEICLGQIPIREMTDGHYEHPLQSDLPQGPIPHPGQPPKEIPPYVYPSQTVQVISNLTVSAYPGSYAPPTGYPYPGNQTNAYPGAAQSYPGAGPNAGAHPPYYPEANPPYPGGNPTTTLNSPYPGANPPYPGGNPTTGVTSPYPGANPLYPVGNPITDLNAPYPGANPPYPGGNPTAGATSPYPGANPPYPGGNPTAGATSPYPGANPPYPGGNPTARATSPYPGANPPYPGGNPTAGATSPYPGANPPYPGGNPTAGATSPYPGANPPYPGGNPTAGATSPYPGANPPYPGGNPIAGANPPYPPPVGPVIGFVASPGNPGYPPATGASTPFNPSAPPE